MMEGKAVLYKKFGNVDAIPICLNTKNTEEIIKTIKILEPCFGGIHLEDICSPKCFEIEKRLEEEMNIPVYHDDQHGTAIVVTAALINALKLVNKEMEQVKVVVNGPGASGTAIVKMLLVMGVKNIIVCDEFGTLYQGRNEAMLPHMSELALLTNQERIKGPLERAIEGADVFIGVSAGNVLMQEAVKSMNHDSIVFALANPFPEISYESAIQAGVKVIGTGRSDYPNQINNVLAFPGVLKGALQARARNITYDMKVAAAYAISDLVTKEELKPEYIIPSVFNPRVVENVAERVAQSWKNRH